ncbi:MAG TPA: hypothetical protein VG148_02625 [Pyrinomonadaceae bacterium]|nr:hypothetical protein [Pyrinomonadaceae bacterium]
MDPESFEGLLSWLDPERERAGEVYEKIRASLVRGFRAHGCATPEDLADETINRVASKLPEFRHAYVGDPARYFHRVAYYIYLEYLRREPEMSPLPEGLPANDADDVEPEYECLEKCIEQLNPRNRELVLQYYQGEKRVKIELRKKLAARFNLQLPLLRLQAHRVRTGLKKCIRECLKQHAA